jgi:hypothetical protein
MIFLVILVPRLATSLVPGDLELATQLMLRRLRVILGGPPAFLIHFEPTAFHGPWFRDADAVHWLSLWDLKRWLPDNAAIFAVRISAAGLRGRFWAHFLLLFVRIQVSEARIGIWEAGSIEGE